MVSFAHAVNTAGGVYDGCGAVRRGAYMHLNDCEYYKCNNS